MASDGPRPGTLRALRPAAAALIAFAALSGCSGGADPAPQGVTDPAMIAAIEAPIMVDPDLSLQNARFAALSPGGPADGSLPGFDVSDDERETARSEAKALAGGQWRQPPAAQEAGDRLDAIAAPVTLVRRAARMVGVSACADKARVAMAWGAKLPDALPAYPRAHLRIAAGSDGGGCDLRAASFVAGAAASDVLSFYTTMAARAGFAVALTEEDGVQLLEGRRKGDGARFGVLVRPGSGGTLLFDLATLRA